MKLLRRKQIGCLTIVERHIIIRKCLTIMNGMYIKQILAPIIIQGLVATVTELV